MSRSLSSSNKQRTGEIERKRGERARAENPFRDITRGEHERAQARATTGRATRTRGARARAAAEGASHSSRERRTQIMHPRGSDELIAQGLVVDARHAQIIGTARGHAAGPQRDGPLTAPFEELSPNLGSCSDFKKPCLKSLSHATHPPPGVGIAPVMKRVIAFGCDEYRFVTLQ